MAHYTGQTELAEAIQEGLAAKAAGDDAGATTKLGRAVQLAAQTGNEEVTTRLRKVVDIDNVETGTVRLKRSIDKADEMALDTASTKTTRVRLHHDRGLPRRAHFGGRGLLRRLRDADRRLGAGTGLTPAADGPARRVARRERGPASPARTAARRTPPRPCSARRAVTTSPPAAAEPAAQPDGPARMPGARPPRRTRWPRPTCRRGSAGGRLTAEPGRRRLGAA